MSAATGTSQTLQLLNTTNKLLELNSKNADGSQAELLKAIAELLRAIFRKLDGGSVSPSRSPHKAGRSMGSTKGDFGAGPQSGEIVEYVGGHASVWLDRGCRVDQREALTKLYNRNRELLMVTTLTITFFSLNPSPLPAPCLSQDAQTILLWAALHWTHYHM